MALARTGILARLALVGAFAVTSVLNYGYAVALTWLLAPADFGVFAFGQAAVLVGGLLLEAGVPLALVRASAQADAERRGRLARGAILLNVVAGGALALLATGLFALGPLAAGFESWAAASAVAGAIVAIGGVTAVRGVAQGAERFGTVGLLQVVEVAGRTAFGALLVLAGLGAFGALVGFGLGAALALGSGIAALTDVLRAGRLRRVERPGFGAVGAMLGAQVGLALLLNLDLLGLKLVLDAGHGSVVGYYQAGVILANAPFFLVASGVVPIAFPRLARCGSPAETTAVLRPFVALVLALVVPCELMLAAMPEVALGLLFPPEYLAAAGALRLRALGMACLTLAVLLVAAYQATGQGRRAGAVLLAASLAELATVAVLGPGSAGEPIALAFAGSALAATVALAVPLGASLSADAWSRAANWAARYALVLLTAGLGALAGWASFDSGVAASVAAGATYLLAGLAARLVPRPALAWPRRRLGRPGRGRPAASAPAA